MIKWACLVPIFVIFTADFLKAHDFELPKEVKPVEYNISLSPNLEEGTYNGTVTITVNVTKDRNSITLHSKNLTITDARVDFQKVEVLFNIPYDFLTLSSSKSIGKGTHVVTIAFKGDMKNKTYGFFRGYEEENGKRVYFGASNMQPINARVAYPCFDEPTFKARFSVQLTKPPGYVALSNTNQIGETPTSNGYTIVHFAQTPPMSSYLVSFFLGKYSYAEDFYVKQNNESVPTRMYSPIPKVQNAKFGAQQIPRQVKWLANYTGFDFMLLKLDYITINGKFHMDGGMEDWGATTTHEDFVFYNDTMSKLEMKRAFNMGHEFAHIWFGDLVTTSSWGEFWLNEGFARFMDRKVSQIYTELEGISRSYANALHSALWLDDDLTAKPLSWEMKKPSEAYEMLNAIAYDKGGSVLRMVEDVIGEEMMKAVIQAYIKKYQYRNVVSQNFVDVLQDFVNFSTNDFLIGFIKQSGYPLITVHHMEDKKQVVLTKKRFLRMGQEDNQTTWSVPIKYVTNLNSKPELVWFNKSENQVVLRFPKEIDWIKLNFGQSGYYRTNYPKEMWQKFVKIIKDLNVEDRIHLLDDSMALVRSGHVDCSLAFHIMNYLKDEPRREAWEAAKNNFKEIRLGLLQHNMTISYLKAYVAELIDKQYKENKWTVAEDETIRAKITRDLIFNLACYYGHEDCHRKVEELWEIRDKLPIDIKNIVLANEPGKDIDYNTTDERDWTSLSVWFGADLSQLPRPPTFRWPKYVMEKCNGWLKDRLNY